MAHIMDYTTEDLAAGILGSTGPYSESLSRATRAIDAAIAAAVAAERERCAKECENFANGAAISYAAKKAMLSCAAAIRALK